MYKIIIVLLVYVASLPVFAMNGTLVFDNHHNDKYPSLYRSTLSYKPQFIPKMLGSGQFNDEQLQTIIKDYPTFNITIIDLREESHGIINRKTPVSWFAYRNWGNQGKSHQQILLDEKQAFNTLESKKITTIANISKKSDDGEIIDKNDYAVIVRNAVSEKAYVTNKRLGYKRLFVTDRQPANDVTVDKWVNMLKKMDVNKTIYYLHCRVGSGRTTQFMVMADIWFNANEDSLQTILKRQHQIGGKDLTQLPSKENYAYPYAVARLKLVEDFYQFVKQYPGGEPVFSKWRTSYIPIFNNGYIS